MVTLGDNRVSGRTRLIFPTDQVIVHSTGDESLPGAWQPMTWPNYEGRDLGLYGTRQNYLGFFVPQVTEGFVALYDEAAHQGIVRQRCPRGSGRPMTAPTSSCGAASRPRFPT